LKLKSDINKDFVIEASFKIVNKDVTYGIGFWNTMGDNKAGLLINEDGRFKLYLLYGNDTCLLNGNRSFQGWKNCEFILKQKGSINKLKMIKKNNSLSIFINDNKIESYKLPDDFGKYLFTDLGIIIEGKELFAKIYSFEIISEKNNLW